MESKLGEGGFGEVWLARHAKTGEQRVFKFCFEAEHLRSLRREVTLFRLLKEELGERHDIARVLDWSFDEPPYYLESEYATGGSLIEWEDEQGGIDQVPLPRRLESPGERSRRQHRAPAKHELRRYPHLQWS
jgi:serine/threonine-protein kinase